MDRIGITRRVITRYEAPPCTTCNGNAGTTTEETTDDGVLRQTWHSCPDCHGSGQR